MLRQAALLALALFAATAAHAQALDGRLKKIVETKVISIAYRADATPFSFVRDNGQPEGFSIDLCKRVVNFIERQLDRALEVKWVPVTVQSRFDAVAKGQADMECGSSTMTRTRMKEVDFSSIIFVETTGLLVKAASGARSLSDLSGKSIAVVGGTTNERAINAQLKRRQLTATVLPFASRDAAMAALEEGKADAFASDKLLLVGAATRAKNASSLTMLPAFVRTLWHRTAARRRGAAPGRQYRARPDLRRRRDRRHLPALVRRLRPAVAGARGGVHSRRDPRVGLHRRKKKARYPLLMYP